MPEMSSDFQKQERQSTQASFEEARPVISKRMERHRSRPRVSMAPSFPRSEEQQTIGRVVSYDSCPSPCMSTVYGPVPSPGRSCHRCYCEEYFVCCNIDRHEVSVSVTLVHQHGSYDRMEMFSHEYLQPLSTSLRDYFIGDDPLPMDGINFARIKPSITTQRSKDDSLFASKPNLLSQHFRGRSEIDFDLAITPDPLDHGMNCVMARCARSKAFSASLLAIK